MKNVTVGYSTGIFRRDAPGKILWRHLHETSTASKCRSHHQKLLQGVDHADSFRRFCAFLDEMLQIEIVKLFFWLEVVWR